MEKQEEIIEKRFCSKKSQPRKDFLLSGMKNYASSVKNAIESMIWRKRSVKR